MCGRYRLKTAPDVIEARFQLPSGAIARQLPLFRPRYNIAPSQAVLGVVADAAGRHAVALDWGFIPHWVKDASPTQRFINARAETVATKPAFRDALRARRCLIPADGFYEWRRDPTGRKTPYHICLKGERPFAFAGLWSTWRRPDGEPVRTCAIITTAANELMDEIHDRMPVIMRPEAEAQWLDWRVDDPARLALLLAPYPADEMAAWPVAPLVNNPRNDTPACAAPVAPAPRA
jgi:putative SOS response-associated peptidase YedK